MAECVQEKKEHVSLPKQEIKISTRNIVGLNYILYHVYLLMLFNFYVPFILCNVNFHTKEKVVKGFTMLWWCRNVGKKKERYNT